MFVTRRRYDAIVAQLQTAIEERDEAREERDNSRRATLHLAKQYTHLLDTGEPMPMFDDPSLTQTLEGRLARALRACARYRADAAGARRAASFAYRLMDNALGRTNFTDNELDAGGRKEKNRREYAGGAS